MIHKVHLYVEKDEQVENSPQSITPKRVNVIEMMTKGVIYIKSIYILKEMKNKLKLTPVMASITSKRVRPKKR